jgi:hypothetical protein
MKSRAIFEEEMQRALSFWGPIKVLFMVGFAHNFPNDRDYAYCSQIEDDTCLIVVAPKMNLANDSRIKAVIRHEIGHAIDFLRSKEEIDSKLLERGLSPIHTPERRADQIAELTYDEPIFYDKETVQSLSGGVRPRPISLGL